MKIYLAGPEVFMPEPRKEGQRLKEICSAHGLDGLFPLDGDLDFSNLNAEQIAQAIFKSNIEKMDQCSAIIANISPFRGTGMDAGTAFEIGYGFSKGKTVVAWTQDRRDYFERVKESLNGQITQSDCFRDPDGFEIENFGQIENLMITSSVHAICSSFEDAVFYLKKMT